jgi:cell division protein FtsL
MRRLLLFVLAAVLVHAVGCATNSAAEKALGECQERASAQRRESRAERTRAKAATEEAVRAESKRVHEEEGERLRKAVSDLQMENDRLTTELLALRAAPKTAPAVEVAAVVEPAPNDEEWMREQFRDEGFMRRVVSARLCLNERQRTKVTEDIRAERKYAPVRGRDVDLTRIGVLERESLRLGKISADLRKATAKPIACSDPELQSFVACYGTAPQRDVPPEMDECSLSEELVRFVTAAEGR